MLANEASAVGTTPSRVGGDPISVMGQGSGSEPDPGERLGIIRIGGILGRLALLALETSGGKSESDDKSGTGKEAARISPIALVAGVWAGPPVKPN